ncbi:MAG: class I SAM-dependent methyltransferase [Bacillota bacterium]
MAGHKFDLNHGGVLDSQLRHLMVPAEKILTEVAPGAVETWADIGCGTGFFTLPLAARVAHVKALDISEDMLFKLRAKLEAASVTNVEPQRSLETLLPLEACSVDGVFMAFVAHELADPPGFMGEVARCLKDSGRLIIIEHARVASPGPPMRARLEEDQVDAWTAGVGLLKRRAWRFARAVVGWEYIKSPLSRKPPAGPGNIPPPALR